MGNPITTRLAVLQSHWRVFAEDDAAVLLRWVLADPYDLPLVDAFFDAEDSDAAAFPDLFLKLESPFDSDAVYGRALALELALRYHQLEPAFAEAGAVTGWTPPRRKSGSDDVTRVYDVADSFHAYHEPFFRRLALFLAPRRIADPHAFRAWLGRAIATHPGGDVRLIVLDDGGSPVLEPLIRAHPRQVHSPTVALGLAQALEELSDQAGGLTSFGGKFRHLFVQTSRAWAAADTARAEDLAAQALALTELASWPALGFAVHYLMGSGYLGQQQPIEAARRFQQAEKLAIAAEERDDPSARVLRLNARMALGAVLVTETAFARAAQLYEETVPLAATPDSPQLHIECWRMAAHAHERAGNPDRAWDCLLKALAVGNELDPPTRRTTTLPFVGEALMRLSRTGRFGDLRQALDDNLRFLLGENWRSQATPQAPSPESAA